MDKQVTADDTSKKAKKKKKQECYRYFVSQIT